MTTFDDDWSRRVERDKEVNRVLIKGVKQVGVGRHKEDARVFPVCNYCIMPIVAYEWNDHLLKFHPHTRAAREIYAYEPDWYAVLRMQHKYRYQDEPSLLTEWLKSKLDGLSGKEAEEEKKRLVDEWYEHVERQTPLEEVPITQEETVADK